MTENVYLFVPNLIGYARIIFLFVAIYFVFESPLLFFGAYGLSQLLDAFDGYAARLLGQSTKFGAVLDMITDRASTAALAIGLSRLVEDDWAVIGLMSMIAIDMMSHYARLYSTLASGLDSHKTVRPTANPLLRIYYGSRIVLFTLCLGQEAFLDLVYLLKMLERDNSGLAWINLNYVRVLIVVSFPLFAVKQLMNLIQLQQSMKEVAELDVEARSKFPKKSN